MIMSRLILNILQLCKQKVVQKEFTVTLIGILNLSLSNPSKNIILFLVTNKPCYMQGLFMVFTIFTFVLAIYIFLCKFRR